ncbi:MAG TPA: hypothetical protein VMT19_05585, partial [Thermoanaerobaculaceae bacterium]|nr:hypothetical protein [Thermoanaerobaculaceae bacterium]
MPARPLPHRVASPEIAARPEPVGRGAGSGGAAARARTRPLPLLLVLAALGASALGARDAAAALTTVPTGVAIFPTQTSGFITVNMTFPPTTFGGTGTITVTTALGPLPTWLTTVPSPITFPFGVGATSASATFRFQASGAAAVGALTVILATGGAPAGVGTGTMTVQILQPSFTATLSPNPASMPWGGSQNVTVTTAADPGFTMPIVYTFTGLPGGIGWGVKQTVGPPYPATTFPFSVAAGTAPGTYVGSLSGAVALNVPLTFPMTVIVQPPDITATFMQPSITACNGGAAVGNSLTLSPANGYVGTPKVGIIPPAGITVTPISLPITAMPPGQTVGFTVSASGASPGLQQIPFRIVDNSAAIDKTIQLLVNVTDPDFTPAVSPPSLTLVPGGASQNLTASLTPNACFTTPTVTVTPSGEPAGVTFTPPTATLTGPAYPPAFLAAQAGPTTVPGTYPITLSFQSSAGGIKSVPATLVVQAAPDFTLAVTPPSLSVVAGSSSTVSVSATALNGFTGTISVTAPALAGVTFTPASFVLTPGGSQVVTVQTALSATPGTSTPAFTGTAVGVTGPRTGTFTLTILPPPDFTISVSPPTLQIAAGTSGSVNVSATGLNGFAGTITVV